MIRQLQITATGLELVRCISGARTAGVRSIREFAESEMRIPDDGSRFSGRRFRASRQPWSELYLRECDNQRWRSIVLQGPTQSGKTYCGVLIPCAYHVVELRENYAFGVPDVSMASTKWSVDIEPVFQASENLRPLLPTKGPGSKGGLVRDQVLFTHGRILKFFTAGGSDESKAGFTARTLGVTEIKRFTVASEMSVEASPLEQVRGRLRSFKRHERREYLEGTVGVADQYPYLLRAESSQSEIYTPCPKCGEFSLMDRDTLHGWQDGTTDEHAAELAFFACPLCDHQITEAERRDMNGAALLVHAGQSIKDGIVIGEAPHTTRLFFRYSAFHNLFNEASDFGADEWRRVQHEPTSREGQNLERQLCQQVWSIPYEMPSAELNPLTEKQVARRTRKPRGRLPEGHDTLVVGIDVGMYRCHWTALTFAIDSEKGCGYHITDYSTIEVLGSRAKKETDAAERQLAVGQKLALELRTFNDQLADKFDVSPSAVWIDAKYLRDVVFACCKSFGGPWLPYFGRGAGSGMREQYVHPQKITHHVNFIGDQYSLNLHRVFYQTYVLGNADHWKSIVHDGLAISVDAPESITMFADQGTRHKTFIRHLLSEKQKIEQHPKFGEIIVWELDETRANHWLDSTYISRMAASHLQTEFASRNQRQQVSGRTWQARRSRGMRR